MPRKPEFSQGKMMMTKHPTVIYVGCLVVHRKPPARL
ncbi:hypothetical protein, partial [Escherichia coli]